jgi:tetratricopeptide (TPR) repeat protein
VGGMMMDFMKKWVTASKNSRPSGAEFEREFKKPTDQQPISRYPMTAGEEKDMGFIKSMSVGEECANFLATRGHCLRAAGRYDEALTAYEQAVRVAPDARFYGCLLATAKRGKTTRPGPFSPGIGMPLDPALQNDPPEIAWGLWRVDEELRRRGLLPRQPPSASKGLPPGQPVEAEDSDLPSTKLTGN